VTKNSRKNKLGLTNLVAVLMMLMCVSAVMAQTAAPTKSAEAATVAPPDSVVADGIPSIPDVVAEKANRYSEFRTANLQSWNPVRREMLIGTRFAEAPQVHLVKAPGGARTQMTFSPERSVNAKFQPKKGSYFIFSRDTGGGEWFQLYREDLASGEVTLLTDGKSRNVDAVWNHQGDRIAYGSTRRNRQDLDLYVMDPADPKTDKMLLQLEGGGWGAADWSPDGKQILLLEEVSANESYLWRVDVAAATKTLITPKGGAEKIFYAGGTFSKDGKGIYTATDKGSEFKQATYIDLSTKQHTALSGKIPWDVEEMELSEDGKTLAFVTNEDGISKLHLLDTATRRERPAPALPIGVISNLNFHENSRDLGFALASARSNSDVYSIDISTGKVDRWTYSETGGLNTSNFPEAQLIKWKSFDGKEISGFLYRPPAKFTGKRPVIVNIHGGPEGQSRPGFIARNNYYLNELGVAMIFPNVRGSEGYGKTFLASDNGFNRDKTYKDIDALLDWINQSPDLDGGRILITGGSYGGHMTLAVDVNYNDKICCSIDVVGISNLVTFLEHTEAYRRDLRRVEYGDERDPKMREYLESIAPMNKTQNITKPMFVVAGANDPRVPKSESDQIVAKVRQNGTPVWYLLGKNEGHGFQKKKNQDFQFYATIVFIQQYLLK
jgi:dipeptidyl aminopeptidase/acylaminoacyl peptidase